MNPWPLGPEPSAIPNFATPRSAIYYILVPNQARYQTSPHPEVQYIISYIQVKIKRFSQDFSIYFFSSLILSTQSLHIFTLLYSIKSSKLPQKAHAGAYFRRTILSSSTKISKASLPRSICNESHKSGGKTKRPAKSILLIIPVARITKTVVSLPFPFPFYIFYHSSRNKSTHPGKIATKIRKIRQKDT